MGVMELRIVLEVAKNKDSLIEDGIEEVVIGLIPGWIFDRMEDGIKGLIFEVFDIRSEVIHGVDLIFHLIFTALSKLRQRAWRDGEMASRTGMTTFSQMALKVVGLICPTAGKRILRIIST